MGGTFGTVVTYPLCGSILTSLSWIWVFYITSILTGVWGVLWFFFMFDDPQEDPYSSDEEKEFIISTRSFNEDQRAVDLSTPILPLLFDMLKETDHDKVKIILSIEGKAVFTFSLSNLMASFRIKNPKM
ncbi:sodium-dependent phosphate transport protein 1 [Eurytemora carolleeae]|uniref:sodium-dependent phosphate transport protein 1 n=1 Tax=Eurytemora carolleeae TaxID=1294199 RepID=UPI000C77A053|nr:sodium-dependent phosphate transport protein 1 [Eurytemora carolleeae]|eukprot:XP_023347886.1 sodium-dependent phosphate transport protein 1-like [Eurytemora affinis]